MAEIFAEFYFSLMEFADLIFFLLDFAILMVVLRWIFAAQSQDIDFH